MITVLFCMLMVPTSSALVLCLGAPAPHESRAHGEPTADAQRLARDVARRAGRLELDGRRDLLWAPCTAQRNGADNARQELLAALALQQRGLGDTGRDDIDPDPEPGPLAGKCLRQRHHARLGC